MKLFFTSLTLLFFSLTPFAQAGKNTSSLTHFIAHFSHTLGKEDLEKLKAWDGALHQFLPPSSYILSLPSEHMDEFLKNLAPTSTAAYPPPSNLDNCLQF